MIEARLFMSCYPSTALIRSRDTALLRVRGSVSAPGQGLPRYSGVRSCVARVTCSPGSQETQPVASITVAARATRAAIVGGLRIFATESPRSRVMRAVATRESRDEDPGTRAPERWSLVCALGGCFPRDHDARRSDLDVDPVETAQEGDERIRIVG